MSLLLLLDKFASERGDGLVPELRQILSRRAAGTSMMPVSMETALFVDPEGRPALTLVSSGPQIAPVKDPC